MVNSTRALWTSWSSTLRLPKSAIPARPPIPSPYLAPCTDELYEWQSKRKSSQKFVLHDGPPYANGGLHVGHALNKILKDIICRYQVSQGKRVQYIPGWDCHGLPIEVKALQALKVHHGSIGAVSVRKAARQLAEKTVKEQMKGFKEWAVMGDWENAYQTMDSDFELRQLAIFKEMVKIGLIYRMKKPVYWSPSSGTALAEAELEYDENHESMAAFIRFPLTNLPEKVQGLSELNLNDLGALVWTTTPWTLPANQAIAVRSDLEYCVAAIERSPSSQFLIAKSRLDYLQSILGEQRIKIIVDSLFGSDIIASVKYLHPLQGFREQPIIHADFVSASTGTGLVHMSPGHGLEDYLACEKLNLEAFAPVDDAGKFTEDALPENPSVLSGKEVQSEGTHAVLDYLYGLQKASGSVQGELIVATHKITHKYPIDWRTKLPVIVRATEQWFADVESLKDDALASLNGVRFIPDTARSRLESFVQGRSQWCISRQRAWGVPIPALYRTDTTPPQVIMTTATIEHVLKVIEERGIDSWWTDAEDDPSWVPTGLQGKYARGKDTMDVWFDSGTSWTLLPEEAKGPRADVYLEGTDQHRGWFQSSLLTHIAHQQAKGRTADSKKPPFSTLITHGFTLDQDGLKMSKSLGNVILPSDIMSGVLLPPVKRKRQKGSATASLSDKPSYDALGPDALRLWVASSDYTKDVVIGQAVLQTVQQNLHKFRITFKWLIGALGTYNPSAENPTSATFDMLDRIALHQLSQTSKQVQASFESYDFPKVVIALQRYVNNDLSAFYFETIKDRLYTGTEVERASAQNVIHEIFHELLAMLGPITPLLVEEVWDFAPTPIKEAREHPLRRTWTSYQGNHKSPASSSNLQEEGKHSDSDSDSDSDLDLDMMLKHILSASTAIKAAQEMARADKLMGSGLESDVHLRLSESALTSRTIVQLFAKGNEELLAATFVVSKVFVHRYSDGDASDEYSHLEGVEQSFELEEADGTKHTCIVLVARPSGDKCGRCWRYQKIDENGLCDRCQGVITETWPELLQKNQM